MTESNPQMNQQIQCPHCGQTYAVRPEQWEQYAGRTINCTRCAQPFSVTGAGGMPAQPPPVIQPQHQAPVPGMTAQGVAAQPYGYPPQAPGQQPQYGYQAVYQPQSPPTSGWAITSLIFGILGFCLPVVGNVVAIITGIIGLVKTRNPRMGGKGLSIAGLCLGGFGLIILTPLYLAIMIPALGTAREQANRVKCMSNMRMLGQAMEMYANNNNGEFPDKLEKLLTADPTLDRNAFVCPDDNKAPPSSNAATAAQQIARGSNCSYVYVGNGVTTAASADTVLLYEPSALHRRGSARSGMNVLFADGHVEWESSAEAQSILDQNAAGTRPIKVTTGP